MNMPQPTDFEAAFKHAAEQFEVLPPAEGWNAIATKLDEKPTHILNKPILLLRWAAVLTLISVTCFTFERFTQPELPQVAALQLASDTANAVLNDQVSIGMQVKQNFQNDFESLAPTKSLAMPTADIVRVEVPAKPVQSLTNTSLSMNALKLNKLLQHDPSLEKQALLPQQMPSKIEPKDSIDKNVPEDFISMAPGHATAPSQPSLAQVIDMKSLGNATNSLLHKLFPNANKVFSVKQRQTHRGRQTAVSINALGVQVSGKYNN
jgi:hypothetical protein